MIGGLIQKMGDLFGSDPGAVDVGPPELTYDDLAPYAYAGQTQFAPFEHSIHDGGKFAGGFGPTQLQYTDYWTLRARSTQLFKENLYARGLVRRLITNEVNTGLTPEASPDSEVLGIDEDTLNDWTETVETRYGLWARTPQLCDYYQKDTLGAIQRTARLEAYIAGDVLTVMRFNRVTGLPAVQLVSGNAIMTPWGGSESTIPQGHTIEHGVEMDAKRRHVAFWVQKPDFTFERIAAYGRRSGRRLAWLVYGTPKRLDDVRGEPLLSIILQSLKEIDRYRDSTQRKAVINSILALFIKKSSDKPGTLPMTGGATRRDQGTTTDSTTNGEPRKFNLNQYIPGMVVDELQEGEEPVTKGGEGTDTNFGAFESAILQAIAWANEVPPEIMQLAFSNNYSASQAAINEFKIYLNLVWSVWGEQFCTPIYSEWLISETLNGRIDAPGLLAAWRDPMQYAQLASWMAADWYGSIKPSTDAVKQGRGSKMLVEEGWSTNAREARVLTGTKFSQNMKRLRRENQLKAEAARPILELQRDFGAQSAAGAMASAGDQVADALDDWSADNGG